MSFHIVFGLILGMIILSQRGGGSELIDYWTTAILFNIICNIARNLNEISGKEQATPPKCIINMLDWHLERRKKFLLKFNINLARLWAELEEQNAAQWKAMDGSDVISTSKAEIMKKRVAH